MALNDKNRVDIQDSNQIDDEKKYLQVLEEMNVDFFNLGTDFGIESKIGEHSQ